MTKIFSFIGSLIQRKPFKSLLLTLLIVAAMIAGASQMRLATGNETLVQADNSVLLSNKAMEESFGGESILILLESKENTDLLSLDNITKLYTIEQELSYEENIFSIVSPATVVHQITTKQSIEIIKQLNVIANGLSEMGSNMSTLGNELLSKDIKDPAEILTKLNSLTSLTSTFGQLIAAQNTMSTGAGQISSGLSTVADGLLTLSQQLSNLASAQPAGSLQTTLNAMAANLSVTSEGVKTIGTNSANLQTGTSNTATALTTISDKLASELSSMKDGLDQGLTPDQLKTMADNFVLMGDKLQSISEGLTIFGVKSSMMIPAVPTIDTELTSMIYDSNMIMRSAFSEVVLNDHQALMVIRLAGNLEDTEKDRLTANIAKVIDKANFTQLTTTMSGKTVLDAALRAEMKSSMLMMIGLAVLVMFGVLLLVFKVKWRMLSLAVVFISVIATLGFMGWIKVPVTMVSMAVFPIIIGLGIDYSIQFHNRYEEEKSVKVTTEKIGKAIAIAVFATILGFISLYASPVPMIQDFGKMLTIGVIISFLGSIFLLFPILHIGSQNEKTKKINKVEDKLNNAGVMDKFLAATTRLMIKLTVPVLLLFVLVAGAGFAVDQYVAVETDIERFMPQDLQALTDIHTIRAAVGTTDQIVVYITTDNVLKESNLTWIKNSSENILAKYPESVVSIKSIDSLIQLITDGNETAYTDVLTLLNDLPDTQRSMFVSVDHKETVLLINTKHLSTQANKDLIADLKSDLSNTTMKLEITGKSVLDVEMVNGLTSGRINMTLLGLGLVFMALLLIYRNLVKAILPIIPVVLIIGISSGVMYLTGIKFTPITATLGALVLGMGTEMTVMLMERYVEERHAGLAKIEAMVVSVTMIGKAIVASGLTTVGGFAVLLFSNFMILKDFGFMTVINISLALLSTFIILPPLIVLVDRAIVKKTRKEKKADKLKIDQA
jgi:hydrophobe/amphiphile efflux-3 (HAE3) family protein